MYRATGKNRRRTDVPPPRYDTAHCALRTHAHNFNLQWFRSKWSRVLVLELIESTRVVRVVRVVRVARVVRIKWIESRTTRT
jgi:hypothetical protein